MRLIVAGGRDYRLSQEDFARLNSLLSEIVEIVSGGAAGADASGEEWARLNGLPVLRFPADWRQHGRAAGPIRNRQMAEYADAVALFPGGRGMANMHAEAVRAGLQVFDWRKSMPAHDTT
jgi:hypothetical protein